MSFILFYGLQMILILSIHFGGPFAGSTLLVVGTFHGFFLVFTLECHKRRRLRSLKTLRR